MINYTVIQSIFLAVLVTDVHKAAELFSKRNKNAFRAVDYQLRPAHTVCGLQIADFYAGAVRKMFLDSVNGLESNLSSPYDRLQHQISLEDYIDLESQKAEP